MKFPIIFTSVIATIPLHSCALVTVPVKIVGTAATTTIKTTGKAIGAGINAANHDKIDATQTTPPAPAPEEVEVYP